MWTWIVGGLAVWVVVAVALGVVLGRGIRLADRNSPGTGVDRPLTTAALGGAPAVARPARRRVPLPPVGVGLALLAVVLETAGYALRLRGSSGPVAQALSMDAPWSLPRTYVATLFAVAAVAAVAGAARNPGRRTWWLAVGAVAAGIAVVKAGSTVHVTAMEALSAAVSPAGAVAVSALAAVAVLAVLAVLSRAERRDRRRVLSTLGLYAVASVGLSALSSVAGSWYATATFVEESGEALAGVAVLMAVLVGVAPRLVLPAAWLRREDDALSLQAPARTDLGVVPR
ncbi:hypothetical protein GCM10027451_43070 [Geodermatophilus aquaeductus]|uniref:Uncharacterized protein n=1 Tax=Geodermatophilus aquaeductus TaxID=1564161 RepID=A0A521FQN2_9ACTN|nr:hypothetical protein [Geodermatophilus aquaeductus]SMO98499.1 hypothetical protein SAMN06273567_11376 [Geodermatophilus aquaeductus]